MSDSRRHGNTNGGDGVTLLMYACQQGHEAEVRHIIAKKPSAVRERDRTKKTALHYCAENSNLNCIDQLLSADPEVIDWADEEGYTVLHLAVISGNRAIVRYLVNKGANLSLVDNEKHSMVHWATVCGEIECLSILAEAGADLSTPDIHGAYPIHYAAQMSGPSSELKNDARIGLVALKRLLTSGVDVNVADQDGRQPLLWAASAGSSDAMLALVNAGANVYARDKDGLTALHCAASRGHNECLETLYSLCGAELEAIDNNGCTSLFYAITLGHADCTEVLLKFGADPNHQDRKGRTPAHTGAAKGQLETLKILAKHGGKLWIKNVRGDLPLHEAVHSGRKDLVLWLLEQRPEAVNAGNNDGRTPLHIAANNNNVEMAKVLMDNRANINPVMKNNKGHLLTPLDVALSRGRGSCAKYLQLSGAMPASKLLTDSTRGSSNDSHVGMHTSGSSPDHDSLTLSENISNFLDRSVGVGVDPTSSAVTTSPHDHKASQVDVLRESLKDQSSQTLANGHHQPMAFGPLHHGNTTAKALYNTHHRHPDIQNPQRRDRSEPSEDASQVSGDTFNTLKDSGIGGQSDRGDYSDFESDNPSSIRGGSDPVPSNYHHGDVTSRHRKRHRTTRMGMRRGGSDGGYDRKGPPLDLNDKESGIVGSKSMDKSKSSESTNDAILDNMKRYQQERRIFQTLLELKRLQIRNGRTSESAVVKRLLDSYVKEGLMVDHQKFQGPHTYKALDNYLYDQLRLLSGSGNGKKKRSIADDSAVDQAGENPKVHSDEDPSKCTSRTYKCHHAAHAYTGIPCAAFIRPKQHTRDSFLPQILPVGKDGHSFNVKDLDPRGTVTLEIKQGKDKKAFSLPTDGLDKNKRFQVTFTIGVPPPFSTRGPLLEPLPSVQQQQRHQLRSRQATAIVTKGS